MIPPAAALQRHPRAGSAKASGMLSAAAIAEVSASLEPAVKAALRLPVEDRSSEALPVVAKRFVAKYILAQLDGEALPDVPASENTSLAGDTSHDTSAEIAELSKWLSKALNAAVRTDIEPFRAVAYYLMMDDIFHLGLTAEQGGRLLQMYEDGVIDRLEHQIGILCACGLPIPEGLNPSMSDPVIRARALLNTALLGYNTTGQREDDRYPPLIDAVIRGEVEAVRSLLNAGADVNVHDGREQLSALHHAIHCPYIGHGEHRHSVYYDMDYPDPKRAAEIMKLLLDAKADTMALIQLGTPPLEWAVMHGKCECVRLLLDGGAEIDRVVRGQYALGTACGRRAQHGGRADIVKLLIERKADVDLAASSAVPTPLGIACGEGHIEIVSALLGAGAAVNRRVDDPEGPLHDASGRGHADVVQLLVEAGADLMDLDICDRTALDCAVANEELECAKILSAAMAVAEQRADE